VFVKMDLNIKDRLRDLKGSDAIVLIALATYINNEGTCFPSIDTLRQDTGLTEHTTIRAIARLRERGFITIIKPGGGRKHSTKHSVNFFTFGKDGTNPVDNNSEKINSVNNNSESLGENPVSSAGNSVKKLKITVKDLTEELEPVGTRAKELEPLTRTKALISQLPIAVRAFLEGYDIEIEGHALESLHSWCKKLPVETILEALKEGVKHDAYSWSYIELILRKKARGDDATE